MTTTTLLYWDPTDPANPGWAFRAPGGTPPSALSLSPDDGALASQRYEWLEHLDEGGIPAQGDDR